MKVDLEKLHKTSKKLFSVAKEVLKEKYERRKNNILVICRVRDPVDGFFVYSIVEVITDIYLEDKEAYRSIKNEVDYITKVLLQYKNLNANDKAYIRAIIISAL